jgi:AcrR family transcriptional regulator
MAASSGQRKRIPAHLRREALIEAAVLEFAHGGLHGTPVERVARRVGVTQPYVFSLFGSKRELFLAAVDRVFQLVAQAFTRTAEEHDPAIALPDADVLTAMGGTYVELLERRPEVLLLQHHAYAACEDPVIRARVRSCYAHLIVHARRLSGAEDERLDEFFRYGMWINVAAALGVEDLSAGCEWVREQAR